MSTVVSNALLCPAPVIRVIQNQKARQLCSAASFKETSLLTSQPCAACAAARAGARRNLRSGERPWTMKESQMDHEFGIQTYSLVRSEDHNQFAEPKKASNTFTFEL